MEYWVTITNDTESSTGPASGSRSGSGSTTSFDSTTGTPYSYAVDGGTVSGASGESSTTVTSYDYSATYSWSSASGWNATGSATSTASGGTDSSYAASGSYTQSGGGVPFSGTVSESGSDHYEYRYTDHYELNAAGTWDQTDGGSAARDGAVRERLHRLVVLRQRAVFIRCGRRNDVRHVLPGREQAHRIQLQHRFPLA